MDVKGGDLPLVASERDDLEADFRLIVQAIKEERCIPFLGAGASLSDSADGLPSGPELARKIAEEVKYPGEDKGDFLRVCQYYETVMDAYSLRRFIYKTLSLNDRVPGVVHRNLAQMPLTHVLTTNFDDLMERAFWMADKQPIVGLYDWRHVKAQDLPKGTQKKPIVYKLHGTAEEDRLMSMLCTEDDVIEFIARLTRGEPVLAPVIANLFSEYNSFLFIGYGLRDWNIRSMMRSLRWNVPKTSTKSFAVQRKPRAPSTASHAKKGAKKDWEWDSISRYWDTKENLKIIDSTAVEFTSALYDRFRLG